MNDGCESLWNEVIRRAVMDAQGKVKQLGIYTKHKSKAYREQTRRHIMSKSRHFLEGGGNWELACDVIGREPIEYSKEIIGGIDGLRRINKRDSGRGTAGRHKRASVGSKPGTKGSTGQKAKSKRMENHPVR